MSFLGPNTREIYLSALRPPEGYTLDHAIGTTYSLHLPTLLSVPLAFALFDRSSTNSDPQLVLQPTAFAHSWEMPPAARRRRRSDSRSQTFGPESFLSRSVVGTGSGPFDIIGCTCKQSSSKRHVALSMGFSGPSSKN